MVEENIFPEDIDEIDMEEEDALEVEDYVGAAAFDVDFVRDGQNKVKDASGVDSWKQWCINCLASQRYASPLYSSDFGIAVSDILSAPTREEAEAMFKAEAQEALEADPFERTDYVGQIKFDWNIDSVNVHMEVVGVDGATIDFETELKGR